MADEPKKLHIAMFPWLAFGHIVPFFELAKLIAQKGHKISFISTPRNMNRLPKLPSTLQHLVELIELPLPHVENLPEDAEATMDIPQHIVPFLKKAFDDLEEPFSKFLVKSKPDWLIHDFAQYWLPPICSKIGTLCINFLIFSAFGGSFVLDSLVLKTYKHPIYESSNKLQSFENKTLSEDHIELNESGVSDVFRVQKTFGGANLVAIRSCIEIEAGSLKFLEHLLKKPVIPIGLLPPSLHLDTTEDSNDGNWYKILEWLDKQEERSVIYAAFGSEVVLSEEDFTEIAMGLELSGLAFFWVLKKQNSPPVIGNGSFNSDEWIEKRSNNNMHGVVWRTWAPQVRILAHKSIGGFLTHCGWSSVIESLQFGCPLIMLPFQNEQGMVARLMEEKGVGTKVPRNEDDGKFSRDSVARALRTVILEDEGKTYRSEAEKLSKTVEDKKLHQKYVDKFVEYLEIHRPNIIKD